jgi:hypothetical protein
MTQYLTLALLITTFPAPETGVGNCESLYSVNLEEKTTVLYKQTEACSQYMLLKL